MAKARTLKTAHEVIEFVDAEECGKLNADRLLGGKGIVARAQGKNIRCFICQKPGHIKSECKVDKLKLFCQHCKQKGVHNTNNKCPEFKKNPDNRNNQNDSKKRVEKPGDKRNQRTRFEPSKRMRMKILQKTRMTEIQTPVLHYPSLAVEYSGGLWVVVQKQIQRRN